MAQVPGNNRGIWKKTEELQRQWATSHGEVYVISGPIYKKPLVVFNGITVPTAVYKIVIDPKKSSMIGFVFPNQSLPVDKLTDFITPINDIEQMTGINFSPRLPVNMKNLELEKGEYAEW